MVHRSEVNREKRERERTRTTDAHPRKMLTLPEKLQTAPALLPMLVEGQKFIDLQDELSATLIAKSRPTC